MSDLNFFTPISYTSPYLTETSKFLECKLLEKIDDYFSFFSFKDKKAYVIKTKATGGEEQVIYYDVKYSTIEKILKVASYFILPFSLLMLAAKYVLRSRHKFKVINPKEELEKGFDVSQETINKITDLLPKMFGGTKIPEIDVITSLFPVGVKLPKVFKLKDNPRLIFKLGFSQDIKIDDKIINSKEIMDQRFKNMIKAKEICLVNDLDLLIIPKAKKINLSIGEIDFSIVIEESLDFIKDEDSQAFYYQKYANELDELVRQIATFISKSGFNDVTPQNIPLMNVDEKFKGPRELALIDLEHMNNPINGFIGDLEEIENNSCGLLLCISDNQFNLAIELAKKNGVHLSDEQIQTVKNKRLEELNKKKQLEEFYKKNKIETGKEPLKSNVIESTEIIGINGNLFKLTLKEAANMLIEIINDAIDNQPHFEKISVTRNIFIPFDELKDEISLDSEVVKNHWAKPILDALVEKGSLYELKGITANGYWIQA